MSTDIMRPTSHALAPSAKGFALINRELAPLATAFQVLEWCRREHHNPHASWTYLGCERRFLDRAKRLRAAMLSQAAAVKAAYDQVFPIVTFLDPTASGSRDAQMSTAMALNMLSVLFGTMSKKKTDDDNTALLLWACVEMFDPVNDAIGEATGLWQPIAKHPAIVALAIKKLIATEVFAPAPSELRAAIKDVRDSLAARVHCAEQFLLVLEQVERIVFEFDRDEWAKAYRTPAGLKAAAAIEFLIEDDDLAERRTAALAAIEEPVRQVACKATPAKRTRKPKGRPADA